MKENHKEDIARLVKDIEDEACNKSSVDKKLSEVRKEVSNVISEYVTPSINGYGLHVFAVRLMEMQYMKKVCNGVLNLNMCIGHVHS